MKAGEEFTVPPQTPHDWWNKGEEELNVLLEFRPAGDFAEFVTTMFAWAQAGKPEVKGLVNLARYAVIDRKYNHVLQATHPPRFVQKLLFALLYPLGRLLGFQPDFRNEAANVAQQSFVHG